MWISANGSHSIACSASARCSGGKDSALSGLNVNQSPLLGTSTSSRGDRAIPSKESSRPRLGRLRTLLESTKGTTIKKGHDGVADLTTWQEKLELHDVGIGHHGCADSPTAP